MSKFAQFSLLIILSLPTFAQVKFVNEFLNLGVGAEAMGKGNVHLTNISDVTAGYWNPSALTKLDNNIEVGLMHNEYFAGIAAYDYGSIGFKIDDSSAVAITFLRFGVDDIPNTLDLVDANGNFNYDRISSFSSTDNALILSYGRRLGPKGLSVGGSAKVIYRRVGEFASAIGFGIDLSASYDLNRLKLGAVFRDATSTFNAWRFNTEDLEEVFTRTGNEIPENSLEIATPRLIAGIGYDYSIDENFSFYPEINLDVTFDGKRNVIIKSDFASVDMRVGLQADYKKMIYLRMGVQNIQEEQFISGNSQWTFQPNVGIGVKFKKVALDYALTNFGNQSAALYSNVFSLRFGINKRQ